MSGGGSLRGLAPRICGSGLFGSGSLYTHIHGLGCKTLAAGLKVAPRPDCADSPFELLGRMGALRVRVSPRPFQSSSADPCRKLLLRSMISLLMVFGLRVGMVESPPNSLTACSSARNILPWVLDESATCKLSWGPGWLLTSCTSCSCCFRCCSLDATAPSGGTFSRSFPNCFCAVFTSSS